MKLLEHDLFMVRWFKKAWEGLVEPAWVGDARERHLSRILNIILLVLLVPGVVFAAQSSEDRQFSIADILTFLMLGAVALAYTLNRQGQFSAAIILTLGLFIASTFASVLLQNVQNSSELSILYYLIIAVLMSDLFFSIRGYLVTAAIILGGVFAISLLNPDAQTIFVFLFVFCALVGFSSHGRRSLEKQQVSLASKYDRDRSLLNLEQRRAEQLSLLEEVGRQITDSLDQKEILEHTRDALLNKFGYAEGAIALMVEDRLEVAAISGNQDFGDLHGFQQEVGNRIIEHIAQTHKAHVAGDVSVDPYYFSTTAKSGSAAGVPMLDEGHLLGVIYVESATPKAIHADDVQVLQTLANQVATSLQKAHLYARTQQHLQAMTALQSISHAVTSSLEVDQVLSNVIRHLRDSFGYTYVSVYLLEGDVLHLGAQLGYSTDILIPEIPLTSGVVGRTARHKQAQYVHDVSKDPEFVQTASDVRSKIAVPLLKDENVLGVLSVESSATLDENDVHVLNAVAGSVAVAIDNARLHAEVKLMAMTDVVSGLANRRAFDEFLESEMIRASRYNQLTSLIILDLDSFKEYNDRWGHPAGDVRLREIADLLRANVREPDLAARYGGEEFAVVLPNTSKSGAIRLAERLRRAAEAGAPSRNGEHSPIPGYTLSLGVATYPDDGSSAEELLHAADHAELMAKRLGKNQVYAANAANKIQHS